MSDFLLKDVENVIVVHCDHGYGPGRIGTIVCSYMMYCGFADCAQNALAYYVRKKYPQSTSALKHISLIRYLFYMEKALD